MEERTSGSHFIKTILRAKNIPIYGVADIRRLVCSDIRRDTGRSKAHFPDIPRHILKDLSYGVVIGLPLSRKVLATLRDGSNLLYLRHYQKVNAWLDKVIFSLARDIQSKGYKALPIPASKVMDWKRLTGLASHRYLGYLAGLGWIGRSSLLVHPRYGSGVCYASLLTNLPLKVDKPLRTASCGKCYACLVVCPAQAIRASARDFKPQRCLAQLTHFAREKRWTDRICGLCVRVCPSEIS